MLDLKNFRSTPTERHLDLLQSLIKRQDDDGALQKLVHDLHAQQIELEMQNRQLREMQQKLEEARDRYADLYDFAPVGYLSLDNSGCIEEINLTAASMISRERSQLLGQPLSRWVAREYLGVIFRHVSSAIKADGKIIDEIKIINDKDELIDVRLESVAAHGESARGNVCRTAMVDITAGKRIREALKESEAKWRSLVENAPDIIVTVDRSCQVLFINSSFNKNVDEIVGSSALDYVLPFHREKLQQAISGVFATGQADNLELIGQGPNDSNCWYSIRLAPIKQDGEIVAVMLACRDISDYIKATSDLMRERDFTSAVLETAGALIVVTDQDGRIVRFNRACEKTTGYSSTEVLGKRCWELFSVPENVQLTEERFRQLSGGSELHECDITWVTRNKGCRRISWSTTSLRNRAGAVEYIIGIGIDNTEKQQAQAILKERERQFGLIADAMPVLMSYVDVEQRYRFINRAYEEWFGYSQAEVEDRHVKDVLGEVAYNNVKKHIEAALAGHEVNYETIMKYKSGGERFVIATYVPDTNEKGEVKGFYALVTDISEHKRAEQALKKSEWHLKQAQRIAHVGDFEWDLVQDKATMSVELCRMFGLKHGYFAENACQRWLSFIHPEDREFIRKDSEAGLRNRQPFEHEYRVIRPDGSVRTVHAKVEVISNDEGKPVKIMGTVQDITKRKRMEEEVRRHQVELSRLSRLSTMGEMASALAHELNQPLCAIASYSQACMRLLRSGKCDSLQTIQAMGSVTSEAKRAAEILRGIRRFVRMDDSRRIKVDINAVVKETVEIFKLEARHQQVALKFEPAEEVLSVIADCVQIKLVIGNLLKNGIEAMCALPDCSQELIVKTARRGFEEVEVHISDYGEGVDVQHMEKIFDSFFTTKPEGMGMGLSMSRSIIEAHGGKLTCTNNKYGGATFTFSLPYGERSNEEKW